MTIRGIDMKKYKPNNENGVYDDFLNWFNNCGPYADYETLGHSDFIFSKSDMIRAFQAGKDHCDCDSLEYMSKNATKRRGW